MTFEILGTLSDGYHEVCTLLQAISLEDELMFQFSDSQNNIANENAPNKSTISYQNFQSDFPLSDFPMNESNLISKAIRAYQNAVPKSKTVNVGVSIRKKIPIGSGLAGGSANAAAALVAINHFLGEELSQEKLLEVGASLGADVPFAIQGGTCIGTHKGDVLQKLGDTPELVMVLAKPRMISVSTPWAFKEFDKLELESSSDKRTASGTTSEPGKDRGFAAQKCTDLLHSSKTVAKDAALSSLETGARTAARAIAENLKNDLEKVVFAAHNELEIVRQAMEKLGAVTARLTGSGPTLYALVESLEDAEALRKKLLEFQSEYMSEHADSKVFPLDFWIAESFSRGARVIDNEA